MSKLGLKVQGSAPSAPPAGEVTVFINASGHLSTIESDSTTTDLVDNGGGGVGGDNISVNATAATDANFSNTTPVAPGDGLNVRWQKDATNPDNISANVPVAAPVAISDSSNSAGLAAAAARSDHTHAHGARGGGALHAVASGSAAGFMSAADFSKLAAFATQGEYIRRTGVVPFTGAQSMGNQNLTNLRTAGFNGEIVNNIPGATPTVDWTTGALHRLDLDTAATTIAFTDPSQDMRMELLLTNKNGGNLTITWPASVKWAGGSAPNIGNTAGDEVLVLLSFRVSGPTYRAGALSY